MRQLLFISLLTLIYACQQTSENNRQEITEEIPDSPAPIVEALSLDGRQLNQRLVDSATLNNYIPKIETLTGKAELTEDDWVELGNHYASLNRYNNAIAVYHNGLNSYPENEHDYSQI